MKRSLSKRWLTLLGPSLALLFGCGRLGYEELGAARPVDDHGDGKAPHPPNATADAAGPSRLDGGTSPGPNMGPDAAGMGTSADTGTSGPDDGGGRPLTCLSCGLGESCVLGACVGECSGNFADAVACEGFESGLSGLSSEGSISESPGVLHTGQKALRAESSGASVSADLVVPISPTVRSGSLYFRGYYYVATPPTTGRIKLLGLDSTADSNVDININPDLSFDLYFHEMTGGARVQGLPGHAVFGAWMCLQVVLELSDTNGKVTISVDGATDLSSPMDRDTSTASGITGASVGIVWSETSGSTVVYVDDVVIDTAPVPCQ